MSLFHTSSSAIDDPTDGHTNAILKSLYSGTDSASPDHSADTTDPDYPADTHRDSTSSNADNNSAHNQNNDAISTNNADDALSNGHVSSSPVESNTATNAISDGYADATTRHHVSHPITNHYWPIQTNITNPIPNHHRPAETTVTSAADGHRITRNGYSPLNNSAPDKPIDSHGLSPDYKKPNILANSIC